jgi:hypothetical protein
MKNATLLFMAVFFSILIAFSQSSKTAPTLVVTFCGKTGKSGQPPEGTYTLAELKNCDWKISPVDTNYTVIGFRMSLVPNNESYKYSEQQMTGNTIPEQYRNQILMHTRNVFLEFIKATNQRGDTIHVKPIALRIQS